MEKYTLKKMIEMIGWSDTADGVFCPGKMENFCHFIFYSSTKKQKIYFKNNKVVLLQIFMQCNQQDIIIIHKQNMKVYSMFLN